MNSQQTMAVLLVIAIAWACAACGSGDIDVHSVQGQVLVDGQPARFASIVFHPINASEDVSALRPAALTDDEGRFKLTTIVSDDGAPAGEYQVTIDWPGKSEDENAPPIDPDDDEATAVGPDQLGGRYAEPNSSGLTAKVEPKSNTLPPFHLTLGGQAHTSSLGQSREPRQ